MKYGRVDVSGSEQCPEEGRLPGKITVTLDNVFVTVCFFRSTTLI